MFKKNWLILSLVLLLIALVAAQCGSDPATTEPAAAPAEPTTAPAVEEPAVEEVAEPVTIEWWTINSEEYSEQVQRDYG